VRALSELFDLSGRVAVVTGGSRGLGLEMAEGLGEAGAALMLCARRKEWLTPAIDATRRRGIRVQGTVCDVAEADQVQAMIDATLAAFNRLDILVNNAGVSWGARPEAMPLDKWQKVIDVNLTGAFLCSQAAGRVMLEREYGRIINVASVAGIQASVQGPHYAAYAAIPVVEPDIKASSPIPRVGAAGELKGVAVFLAAAASNYITGQVIVVDGGRSIS
jgi:gluconate 5-dehydrogenase